MQRLKNTYISLVWSEQAKILYRHIELAEICIGTLILPGRIIEIFRETNNTGFGAD